MKSLREIEKRIEEIRRDVYNNAEKWSDEYIKRLKEEAGILKWVIKERKK